MDFLCLEISMEPSTREVVKRSPSHTVRLIPLAYLQREPVEADSSLESDFIHTAARYAYLLTMQHQPFKLNFEDSSYTPDFLLTFKDGSRLVVEVKPADKVHGYRELFDKASRKLQAAGYYFLVADDKTIRRDDRADNARVIRRYSKTACRPNEQARILALLEGCKDGICIADLEQMHGVRKTELYCLIARNLLCTLPLLSLSDSAKVFIPHTSEKDGGINHAVQFAGWFDAEIWR